MPGFARERAGIVDLKRAVVDRETDVSRFRFFNDESGTGAGANEILAGDRAHARPSGLAASKATARKSWRLARRNEAARMRAVA